MALFARSGLVVGSVLASACGVFGGEDTDVPPAPPDRSQENATPPVSGQPLEGVFVSSSRGNDDADGTQDRPLKTLGKAVSLARQKQLRVLACAEEYREALVLQDGVSIYGDLDCNATPWVRKEGARSKLLAPSSPALLARDVTKATRIEAVDVVAPDGNKGDGGNGSSIGAWVKDSSNLILAKATITAGNGAAGTDGADPPASAQSSTGIADGFAGSEQVHCQDGTFATFTKPCADVRRHDGAPGGNRACLVGPQPGPGGRGGDGRKYNQNVALDDPDVIGGDGLIEQGYPLSPTPQTAQGGSTEGSPGGLGTNGSNGANGANGAWSFGAEGFVAGNGTAGGIGTAGQGGGGGAGRENWCNPNNVATCLTQFPPQNALQPYYFAAAGAGGGAGGCVGIPGTPGTGGGASIAAISWKSSVTFDNVKLVAKTGGRAGRGALGLPGQAGGKGGKGTTFTFFGGDGGRGGHPGLSGHGAPGPSIALAFTDPAPVRVNLELTPGQPGAGQEPLTRETQSLPAVTGEALGEHRIEL